MNMTISTPQCYTAKGKKPNQEDSLFPLDGKATQESRVFLVCDGMGGHEHGEVASACVADTIGRLTSRHHVCSTEKMRDVFEKALEQSYRNLDALDTSDSERKMGTTLTFLAFCTDGVLVAHIGDSRVYQIRPGRGIVFQTRDHSLVNDLIASGELTEEEARTFPQRNVITRAIQPHQEYPAKATYSVLTDICQGDLFFMCCDGVVEQLDNNDLCTYLLDDKPLKQRLASIRKECEVRGTRDNNTAYLIEICDAESVTLTCAKPSSTQSHDIQPKSQSSKPRLLIMILLATIVFILAFIFFSAPQTTKKEKEQEIQKTEQLQGTIKRHNK